MADDLELPLRGAAMRGPAVDRWEARKETGFYSWRDKGGSIAELLAYARLRPVENRVQAKFAF